MTAERTIGIAGAGSIGCFVGGILAAGGRRVALLARPRVISAIEDSGLRLTGFEGLDLSIPASQLTLSADPSILGDAAMVLVTVKSADTAGMADLIARHALRDVVAGRHGLQAPLSRRIVALIKSAEAAGKGSPGLTPEQIRP